MSKKKDPMALFEVLSRQDNPHSATKVPAWMKRKPAEPADSAASDATETADAETAEEAVDAVDAPDGEYVVDADDVAITPPEESEKPEEKDAAETAAAVDTGEADEEVDEDLLDEVEDTDNVDEATEEVDEEPSIDEADIEDTDEAETDDEIIDEATEELDEDELEETEYDADDEEEADLTEPDTDDEIDEIEDVEKTDEADEADKAAAPPEVAAAPVPAPPALPSERPSRDARPTTAQPWLSVADERLRIAVPILWAAVAAGGVVLAMALAFVLGRVTAPAPEADATPTPRTVGSTDIPTLPPDDRLQPAQTAPKPIVAARSGQRDPNRQYLVIQTLQGKRPADFDEAERIIRFAASHGLPADMVYMGSGQNQKLVVWSLMGVTERDSDAARRLVEKVEQVGKMYFDRYETYDFRQRSDGRLQPFWVSGKAELKR